MSATWSTPLTWQVDQLVTEADLNRELRDNLNFLKDPPTAFVELAGRDDYSTTSTRFVDVDRQRLALSVTTAGGDLLVAFFGMVRNSSSSGGVSVDVSLDGTRLGGETGLIGSHAESREWTPLAFLALARELAAGPHNLFLQWRRNPVSGSATLAGGAGDHDARMHGQFWAREVS